MNYFDSRLDDRLDGELEQEITIRTLRTVHYIRRMYQAGVHQDPDRTKERRQTPGRQKVSVPNLIIFYYNEPQ